MPDPYHFYKTKLQSAINEIDATLEKNDKLKTDVVTACSTAGMTRSEAEIMERIQRVMMQSIDVHNANLRSIKLLLQ